MRRLFVPAEQWLTGATTLEGDAHRHLARVLRARTGDTLTLFDGDGREIEAQVTSVERDRTRLTLGQPRRAQVAAGARIVLLQSLARGERMDWIVQKTTELGVAGIIPVAAGRSVARLGPEAAAPRRARWEKIAREAARQCGRADVPVIHDPLLLDEALAAGRQQEAAWQRRSEAGSEAPTDRLDDDDDDGDGPDTIDDRAARGIARFALWEASRGHPLRAALSAAPRIVTLLVGPEGGFAAAEVDAAVAAGFLVVGLGSRILRVETAAVVAVALAQAAAGGLD